ncbi:MAG: ribose-5-phosphate isomerase RpiA [Acidobacteriia bacterium]|nr:ribose-5-phosphate isomerase RpiA [Methyloceanibacter sp.]MBX5472678.1 ribose-5-phosphate isomerase RpiA [Acetobacteraceae bacterium]MCL6490909.1 ribose-5-phosphate isomerase RpiA [Terriglobia bacterium]
MKTLLPQESWKAAAAAAAVEEVREGMVLGLGTGSTAAIVVDLLGARVRDGLHILGIPTSERTAAQARANRIPLTDFSRHAQIDLTIDGADQVARASLHLIKGMGGALLREKIVACASARVLIVADGTKLAEQLSLPVPVEVVPFGWEATARKIARFGGQCRLRLNTQGEPYRTDGGNFILDCDFGAIADPASLDARLRSVVGVVETGFFIDQADTVIIADAGGIHRLERARTA